MLNQKFVSSCISLLALSGAIQAGAPSAAQAGPPPAPPAVAEPDYSEPAPIYSEPTPATHEYSRQAPAPAPVYGDSQPIYEPCPPQTYCCCPPKQCWQFSAGALFLTREYNNAPIVTGAQNLGTNAFDGDYETGFELSARNNSWEVRYFQVDSFSDTVTPAGAGGTFLGVGGLPAGSDFVYDTELYSGEINRFFSPPCEMVRTFAGFRYIQLDEELNLNTPAVGNANRLTTDNDLYGFQVGVDACLWRKCGSRFSVNSFAKGGIYYADTDVSNTSPLLGAAGTFRDTSDSVAFVGELGVTAGYQLTNWLSLDASYQALWVDGVALAGEQASSINIGGASTINHGDVLFHGARVGMTATW